MLLPARREDDKTDDHDDDDHDVQDDFNDNVDRHCLHKPEKGAQSSSHFSELAEGRKVSAFLDCLAKKKKAKPSSRSRSPSGVSINLKTEAANFFKPVLNCHSSCDLCIEIYSNYNNNT